jgi:hypothetical protein
LKERKKKKNIIIIIINWFASGTKIRFWCDATTVLARVGARAFRAFADRAQFLFSRRLLLIFWYDVSVKSNEFKQEVFGNDESRSIESIDPIPQLLRHSS